MKTAIRIFGGLKDMRQEKKVRHELLDIVMLTVIGVMCGCVDWEEVAEFGRARIDVLRKHFRLGNGIPAHDTFRRVMGMVDSKALERCYWAWVKSILPNINVDYISIDGKTIKGSGKPGLKPIHLVSAWSSKAGITLAQLKTAEKSNEITAIPDLLDMLEIEGSVITIDAMGCQIPITEKIIEKGGDYVIACKDNQPCLHNEIKEYYGYVDEIKGKKMPEEARKRMLADIQYETTTKFGKSHGRKEERTYELISDCNMLSRFHDFAGAKSIGRVSSHIERKDGTIQEDTRHFLTSLRGADALERFALAVRKHWGIENSCHWVLDVTFHEDACRTRDLIAAQNLAVSRKLALALAKRVPDALVEKYSHNKAKYTSLNKRLFLARMYPAFMMEILLSSD